MDIKIESNPLEENQIKIKASPEPEFKLNEDTRNPPRACNISKADTFIKQERISDDSSENPSNIEIFIKQEVADFTSDETAKVNPEEYNIKVESYIDNHNGKPEEPFTCYHCGCTFPSRAHLRVHFRTHSRGNLSQYLFSNYSCSAKDNRTNVKEKPFNCVICDLKFSDESNLSSHILKIHSGESPTQEHFTCSVCDYRCTEKVRLTRHLQIHSRGDKSYSCNVKEFESMESTNTNGKRLSCSFCRYKCNRKSDLNCHLRSHSGIKPFSCSMCDYKCNHKYLLTRHVRTHTGERPYGCNFCDYRAARKSRLVQHLKIHTREMTYRCPSCDYTCIQKKQLVSHVNQCFH